MTRYALRHRSWIVVPAFLDSSSRIRRRYAARGVDGTDSTGLVGPSSSVLVRQIAVSLSDTRCRLNARSSRVPKRYIASSRCRVTRISHALLLPGPKRIQKLILFAAKAGSTAERNASPNSSIRWSWNAFACTLAPHAKPNSRMRFWYATRRRMGPTRPKGRLSRFCVKVYCLVSNSIVRSHLDRQQEGDVLRGEKRLPITRPLVWFIVSSPGYNAGATSWRN